MPKPIRLQDQDGDTESNERHSNAESDASSTSTLTASRLLEEREKAKPSSKWRFFVAASLVGTWMVLSSILILSNKFVIDTLGFRYPITLTCWHLFFASIMTQMLAHTTTLLDNRHKVKMTGRTYLRAIIPIGALYCGSLVSSNLPYLTLSVAFIQMLKGLGPAAVLIATWSVGLEASTWKTWVNIVIIVLGVMTASLGEIKFVLSGFLYQMGGILFEAYRLALIQRLLSSDEQKMDPLVSLYYYAPICTAMIAVVAMIGELPSLRASDIVNVGFWTFFANAGVAFSLNVASVMVIGKTSSLVLILCGTLKNILLVIASVLIWGTVITRLQIVGYGITSVGLLYYSLGADTIHGLFRRQEPVKEGQTEKATSRWMFGRRKIALIMVGGAAIVGAIGGAVAGYNVEWDPRLYWYSATRFSD